MLRRIVVSPLFALANLFLVTLSGAVWVLLPKFGIWSTLIALLPFGLRLLAKEPVFQRTPLDWAIVIFLITAWIGYWAAYDRTTAWIKVWLVVTTILLYYTLSAQPKQNLELLSLFSFCLGIAVSAYFFLTEDFTNNSVRIAQWWMRLRPFVGWPAIHHDYISGLLVITNLFAFDWLSNTRRKPCSPFTIVSNVFVIFGLVLVFVAFILTMSRGVWVAGTSGIVIWITWRVITSKQFGAQVAGKWFFPLFALGFICVTLAFAYLGSARMNGGPSQTDHGINSRSELFGRGAYLLLDFPIIGGGLSSFPGLYSQYIINIPFFYFLNSYNMFLDVAIEQGLIGGFVFTYIYFGSIWFVSQKIMNTQSHEARFFNWLSLFALVFIAVHSFFYDYLYNGLGTFLLLFPVGLSMVGVIELDNFEGVNKQLLRPQSFLNIRKKSKIIVVVPALIVFTIIFLNVNRLISIWYSNMGSVQMSRVELSNFPTNQWATPEIVPQLEKAEISFNSALRYNPDNQTANYRLGMVSMQRRDYKTAASYLEKAIVETPNHRGVIKTLGYCYIWLGEMAKAQVLLEQIPEAQEELKAYIWWWGTQGRDDLSTNASMLIPSLQSSEAGP